jgi:F420-0:gamma-glutamyl ligase
MANLIRLKQIESSSFLETAGAIVQDFSQSVNSIISQSIETTFSASIVQIITNNVGAVLPNGVISSSVQVIDILIPLNQHSASINQFTASLNSTYATDAELAASQSNINIDMGEW